MGGMRHSYVQFYPSDWLAGTMRLTRDERSIYFDVCLHNWDRVEPLAKREQARVLGDVPDWETHIEALIEMGKLKRTQGGGLYSQRAMDEATRARESTSKAVAAGRKGAAKRWGERSPISDRTLPDLSPISKRSIPDLQTNPLEELDNSDSHPNGHSLQNQNQNQNHNVLPLGRPKERTKTREPFVLPNWVPKEAWDAWVEVRARKRAANTPYAKGLALKRLDDLRRLGHDPRKLLDLATLKGWTSLYPDDRNGETRSANRIGSI